MPYIAHYHALPTHTAHSTHTHSTHSSTIFAQLVLSETLFYLHQEQELSEQRLQVDIPALERAMQSLREEKRRLDERVSTLQQELGRISQQSGVRGALEAFRRDKRAKEEHYQNE